MAEIVSLRHARKARVRAEAESKAAANRILFGQTKAARVVNAEERARLKRQLDGHALPKKPQDT